MSVWPRKEQQPRKNTHPSHSTSRTTRLGCQALEQRWVLSSAPFLEGFVEQWIDTGETLTVDAMFADVLEGTVTGGGPGVGLDPLAYTSLGAFDPASNVVVDTSNPLQPKLSVGASDWFGVYENANAGADSYTIAVFTFTDFELDAGITLSATGDSPLAILSQGDISISGTIDVSINSMALLHRLRVPAVEMVEMFPFPLMAPWQPGHRLAEAELLVAWQAGREADLAAPVVMEN